MAVCPRELNNSKPMKIAIFDTVPKSFWHHDNGITDAEKFADFLGPAMPGWTFHFYYSAEDEFPQHLADFDGFLITGSPVSVNDNTEWMKKLALMVNKIEQMGKPLAGFCFGHQLIAKALGGSVGLNQHGWNIGLFDLDIETPQPWMNPAQPTTKLYHFNKERVLALPRDAIPFAGAEGYPYFGYAIGDRIMAIQGHPEQPRRAMENFLKGAEDVVQPGVVQKATRSFDTGQPDSELWARWVSAFYNQ